jgi:hypothetical protein
MGLFTGKCQKKGRWNGEVRECSEPRHNALDLDPGSAEVAQKADLVAHGLQIVQAFGVMNIVQLVHGFQFHQHRVFHQKINSVLANSHTLIEYNYTLLLRHNQAGAAGLTRRRISD